MAEQSMVGWLILKSTCARDSAYQQGDVDVLSKALEQLQGKDQFSSFLPMYLVWQSLQTRRQVQSTRY